MVPIKWGDVLSTLLPGAVALVAIAPYFPLLNDRIQTIGQAGPAVSIVLLMAAALAGGVLEALTRITWEQWLVRRCKSSTDVLSNLDKDTLDLYERGVQSSYKYVTFYANFAWAMILLLISRILGYKAKPCSVGTLILMLVIPILLRASYVQWTYYVNYQNKVFAPRSIHVKERPAAGNES